LKGINNQPYLFVTMVQYILSRNTLVLSH